MTAAYGRCRTYRDKGSVIVKSWTVDRTSHTAVRHFDTLFLRDRGLRFRTYSEDGERTDGIWLWDGRATVAFMDMTRSLDPSWGNVQGWLSGSRGVTHLVSAIVPNLLFGHQPLAWIRDGREQPECNPEPVYSKTVSYERDTGVLLRLGRNEVLELSLDLRRRIVHRAYRVTEYSPSEARRLVESSEGITWATPPDLDVRFDTWILYEAPTCDLSVEEVASELAKPPW